MRLEIDIRAIKIAYFEPEPIYGLWDRRTLPKLCGIDGRGAQDDFLTTCRDSGGAADIYLRFNISRSDIGHKYLLANPSKTAQKSSKTMENHQKSSKIKMIFMAFDRFWRGFGARTRDKYTSR